MEEIKIKIDGIEKVKSFIKIINKYPFDAEIRAGRYIIDAKSIMGVFSIDITNAVRLYIDSDDKNSIDRLKTELKKINVLANEEE